MVQLLIAWRLLRVGGLNIALTKLRPEDLQPRIHADSLVQRLPPIVLNPLTGLLSGLLSLGSSLQSLGDLVVTVHSCPDF